MIVRTTAMDTYTHTCFIDCTECGCFFPAGHERVQDVTGLVFAYINVLAAPGGVTQKRFEENKALAELRFKFADKSSPYTYAERLSSAMQTYEDRYNHAHFEPICMLRNLQ